MTQVLLLRTPDPGAPDLVHDFQQAGFGVCGTGECAHLVRETLRAAPDVLVCWAPRADDGLLHSVANLQAQQCVPVLVFTDDTDVERMQRALEAGVHAWVVQGYAPQRLRALVHLALQREAHERRLHARVAALEDKLDERKWVDRAKGVLMRAQGVGEQEAFQFLRNASMHGNRKVGQVSREVIEAAQVANAINRAGQQRMLAQRLVKLYALACRGLAQQEVGERIAASVRRVDANLEALAAELSQATYGDLVTAAQEGWAAMRPVVIAAPQATELSALDRLASAVVQQSEALVRALEHSGLAMQVGVVNIAGRQRMLSQRMAALALMRGVVVEPVDVSMLAHTAGAFEDGLRQLHAAPLSTPEIRILLGRGESAWQRLLAAAAKVEAAGGAEKLFTASEELLELFDTLTQAYQDGVVLLLAR